MPAKSLLRGLAVASAASSLFLGASGQAMAADPFWVNIATPTSQGLPFGPGWTVTDGTPAIIGSVNEAQLGTKDGVLSPRVWLPNYHGATCRNGSEVGGDPNVNTWTRQKATLNFNLFIYGNAAPAGQPTQTLRVLAHDLVTGDQVELADFRNDAQVNTNRAISLDLDRFYTWYRTELAPHYNTSSQWDVDGHELEFIFATSSTSGADSFIVQAPTVKTSESIEGVHIVPDQQLNGDWCNIVPSAFFGSD